MDPELSVVVSDAFFHRMIDDLTAIVALSCLARYHSDDALLLAHLQHLELIAREQAARIQQARLALSVAAGPAARVERAMAETPCPA